VVAPLLVLLHAATEASAPPRALTATGDLTAVLAEPAVVRLAEAILPTVFRPADSWVEWVPAETHHALTPTQSAGSFPLMDEPEYASLHEPPPSPPSSPPVLAATAAAAPPEPPAKTEQELQAERRAALNRRLEEEAARAEAKGRKKRKILL
jgi:hypothetical protein